MSSESNNIHDNILSYNAVGLNFSSSYNNSITENEICENTDYGLYFSSSFNNTIFHNNIMTNAIQAHDDSINGNFWDDGYPSGGNYWNDWATPDVMKGINQDISGSDGIVDDPYLIDGDSQDGYPLTNPLDKIPPVIWRLNPQDGSKIDEARPIISASIEDDSGINFTTLLMKVDEVDVTTSVIISLLDIIYTPVTDLPDRGFDLQWDHGHPIRYNR
jgi:hypothetical protein